MARKSTTPKKKVSKTVEKVIDGLAKELATGITSQKLSPFYFNNDKLKYQPVPLYRLDSGDNRYYYAFNEEGEPEFYPSVTTLIRNTLPTSPHLINWLVSKGGSGKDEANERASYGTFLHAQCGTLLVTGRYDLDKLTDKLAVFLKEERLPEDRLSWADELKKDILSFAQFMVDYNIEPLAIEIILAHPIDKYAGAIDLVCLMDWEFSGYFGETYASGANKGQPKISKRKERIVAIVDIKSGRKGFYESHEIQLHAYKSMWDFYFTDTPAVKVINFSPKEWHKSPSYNLKDQSDSRNASKLPHLVSLAKIEDSKRENKLTVISGEIDLTKGFASNIEELTFADLVKRNK